MKIFYTVSSLIFFTIVYFGAINIYHKKQVALKIQEVTQTEADSRKLCTSEDSQSRLDCMKPRLEKVKNQNFKNEFSLFVDGKKEQVEVTDLDFAIKIKRSPLMFFGGQCLSNFFYFDFDNNFLYLSKDNASGIVVCKSGVRRMILFPSQLSDKDLETQLKSLQALSF
jgi:hypothetical protein